ncbi:MAG: flagellar motor switch protein FliN [Deltaproteobacteria bacterium]|nr:MAG: flagellar motor switch protein FliN [Deltaproteobacteria bacterium]
MAKEGEQRQRVVDYDWEKVLNDNKDDPVTDNTGTAGAVAPASRKPATHQNLELLLDIPLEITAELGRAKMIINDLLQLGQGSVIELNKLAGEPLEIMVNQKLIARGEVVVVNEKFGIRLTDVISPLERIKQLT